MKRRILVIDDDTDLLGLLKAVLGERHEVQVSADGAAALRLMGREPFDLVILDLHMPGMSGEEVKREMDLRGHRPPVLLLSGDPAVRDHAQRMRAGDFLSKPFLLDHLGQRVAVLLRDERGWPPAQA